MKNRAAPSTETFVASDGVEISFRRWGGSGVPVVLLHGFIATGRSNWVTTGVVDALTEIDRDVVVPDARGHGKSGKPRESRFYGERRMAADVVELVDRLGLGAFDLMGYSMGAIVALLIAAELERVRRLVLGGVGETVVTEGGTAVDRESLARALEVEDPTVVGDETARRFRRFAEAMSADRRPLVAHARAGSRERFALHRISAPTLVIAGADDDLATGSTLLADAIPNASSVIVAGDHFDAVERPDFIRAVIDFLGKR